MVTESAFTHLIVGVVIIGLSNIIVHVLYYALLHRIEKLEKLEFEAYKQACKNK